MSTAHTTGPWVITDDGTIEARHRGLVGHLSNASEGDSRLIATAPELLSALVALEQAYSNRHSPQHREACRLEALSVIAKATGGKP